MPTTLTPTASGLPARATRWAALPVGLMGLLNVPSVLASDADLHIGAPLRVLFTVVGLLGVAAAVGLLIRRSWATRLALAICAVNAASGAISLARGYGMGIVGIVLGLAGLALALVPARGSAGAPMAA